MEPFMYIEGMHKYTFKIHQRIYLSISRFDGKYNWGYCGSDWFAIYNNGDIDWSHNYIKITDSAKEYMQRMVNLLAFV